MKNDIQEIGLRILASETSFVINLGSDFVINQNELVGDEAFIQALYEMLMCFATETVDNSGISNLRIESYLQYDESVQKKIEDFINKYKLLKPQLCGLEQHIKKIKLGEYICILPSILQLDTEQIWEIYQELDVKNGKDAKISIPLLKEYNMCCYGEKEHTNIGHQDKNLRKCRWCKKTKYEGATFNKKAHAITEALGNKNIVLLDECDSCNEKFGQTIEQSIIAQFRLFNTMFGIRGKRGVANIKDIKTKTSVEHMKEKEIIFKVYGNIMNFNGGVPASITLTVSNNYIAQDVYKSLCKYALSVIEDESVLSEFSETIEWINGNTNWDKTPIVKVLNSYMFFSEHPLINVYIRKTDNQEYPKIFAEFRHTNFVMIYVVPQNQKESARFKQDDCFNKFWNLTFYKNIPNWQDFHFSNSNKCQLQFKLNFEKNKG